ncbi:MAG TPA: RNA polymerase sigma factor [Candidatus Paceibacterota bacterium]|nr:RNA polymerase sigma factor [Candidatus Paceibacterota bacterium]
MQESEILARIAAGDTEQFGLLYDAYAERIYRYIFYRTRNRAMAEDLTSTTFFKAVRGLRRFDASKGEFSAWLYRIARNSLFDHYRNRHNAEPIELADEIADPAKDVESEVGDRELVRKVKESFSKLSDDQREIVTMRVWDGLSYAEIAKVLGKSEGSCKMAFYRATIRLKELAPLALIFLIIKII